MSNTINIDGSDDQFYRYKMQLLLLRFNRGRRRTFIMNLDSISKSLDRSIDFIKKYFNKKLSTPVNWDKKKNELELAGIYTASDLQAILQLMINDYVLCRECGNPETQIVYSRQNGGKIKMKCKACPPISEITAADNTVVFDSVLKFLKNEKTK